MPGEAAAPGTPTAAVADLCKRQSEGEGDLAASSRCVVASARRVNGSVAWDLADTAKAASGGTARLQAQAAEDHEKHTVPAWFAMAVAEGAGSSCTGLTEPLRCLANCYCELKSAAAVGCTTA